MNRAVIIGAGIAGVSAAAGMRKAGFEGEIILLGDENELPYRRPPVSKEILRGEKTADEIRIKKHEWYAAKNIRLSTGTRVESIDPKAQLVHCLGAKPIDYDLLLIATGGRARTMGDSSGIRTVRTLADVSQLQAEISPGNSVLVVGAGLIGSEIAASARQRGAGVTLLEAASLPLSHVLPPHLGQMYADLHKREGTDLHTDVAVESICEEDGTTVVRAVDGRTWRSPVVVVAIGMEPEIGLAEQAGIECATTGLGGITVDDRGQTSIPNIYAAGDVANMPNEVLGRRHRVEHWQNAQNHGTAVGKAMAGSDSTFNEVPWCWSDQYGLTLQVAGWPESSHDVRTRGSLDEHSFSAFYCDGQRIMGAVTIDRPMDVRTARKWIAARTRIDPELLDDENVELADAVLPEDTPA